MVPSLKPAVPNGEVEEIAETLPEIPGTAAFEHTLLATEELTEQNPFLTQATKEIASRLVLPLESCLRTLESDLDPVLEDSYVRAYMEGVAMLEALDTFLEIGSLGEASEVTLEVTYNEEGLLMRFEAASGEALGHIPTFAGREDSRVAITGIEVLLKDTPQEYTQKQLNFRFLHREEEHREAGHREKELRSLRVDVHKHKGKAHAQVDALYGTHRQLHSVGKHQDVKSLGTGEELQERFRTLQDAFLINFVRKTLGGSFDPDVERLSLGDQFKTGKHHMPEKRLTKAYLEACARLGISPAIRARNIAQGVNSIAPEAHKAMPDSYPEQEQEQEQDLFIAGEFPPDPIEALQAYLPKELRDVVKLEDYVGELEELSPKQRELLRSIPYADLRADLVEEVPADFLPGLNDEARRKLIVLRQLLGINN